MNLDEVGPDEIEKLLWNVYVKADALIKAGQHDWEDWQKVDLIHISRSVQEIAQERLQS